MKVLMLPGDGIGPEIMAEAQRVLEHLASNFDFDLEIEHGLIGGASYDAHGEPLTDETLKRARAADAVIMGAVGGPKWADSPYHRRPEQGLLNLRQGLGLFANLRPAICFRSLASASTLKPELVEGLDILIVRELIGGIYFGEPRGIEPLPDGQRRSFNTSSYTTSEINRVARVAFDIARLRGSKVCSVEKSNVMESGLLWREEVSRLGAAEYSDVHLSHMYADNCGMQLVRQPKQFDVILTDNLFGDLLSDVAAMLAGSLGMLPSAALGEPGKSGLFEPVHGSAPDIAGKGLANPCATILSVAMALRLGLGRPDLADRVEAAVEKVLDAGYRTADLGLGTHNVGSRGMGDAIIAHI
jgi:3-isopropylmalate dehydrogenase